MPLTGGTKLGPYEIVGPLGAGGMGEVYRARDSRLARDVAIKVLHSESGLSADRRRRFEIEARAASGLNHPNILTIYDFGEEGGLPYIVSELVAGESLREVIERGALPPRSLLEIAVQIADGLSAAHAAGITHRDLKPDNLLIAGGRVKIVDFGLAKAAEQATPDENTRTALTSPGNIVGTIAYMSPEQAQGRTVDYRSDQFSFGLILYEMASGKRAFDRGDRVSTLSAICKEEPVPLTGEQAPPPLRWIVDRCLAKEPARRFASTAGLHEQLRDLRDHLTELSGVSAAAPATAPPPASRRRFLAPLLALTGLAAGVVCAVLFLPKPARPEPYRYTPFATDAVDESQPAWSPDGQTLAYVAPVNDVPQIFTRALTSSLPAQITRSQSASVAPFWAPDGTRIYYYSSGSLWSVGAAGGAPQEVVKDVAISRGPAAAISPDGKVFAFFRREGPLNALYLQAGTAAPVAYKKAPFPGNFRFFDGIAFAPDGKNLMVTVLPTIDVKRGVEAWILPMPDGTPHSVPFPWPATGRPRTLVWAYDSRHCVLSNEPIPGSGAHLYLMDTVGGAVQLLTGGTGEEREPAVSPDGHRIAFSNGVDDVDLMEISIDGTKATPLLATSRPEHSGAWSPSGLQYVYVTHSYAAPALWMRSVAEGWARPFAEDSADGNLDQAQPRFSPDGARIAYVRTGARHAVYISGIAGGQPVPLERESSDQHTPAWSPDGNWIAYTRYAGQNWEVAKAPSGGGGHPVRLGEGGDSAGWMEWSPSGDWIAARDPNRLQLFSPDGGAARKIHGACAAFAFSRDGGSLLVLRRGKNGYWELATLSVPDGAEKKTVAVNLPRARTIRNMSLHPDGTRLIVGVGVTNRDIWILDGFDPSR